MNRHLISLLSQLEANASTLNMALDRLRDTLSTSAQPESSSLALSPSRRAEKLPSTHDALERVQMSANEIIALVALLANDVARYAVYRFPTPRGSP